MINEKDMKAYIQPIVFLYKLQTPLLSASGENTQSLPISDDDQIGPGEFLSKDNDFDPWEDVDEEEITEDE
jgi:hypothetical protein